MYGYEDHIDLNPEQILQKITQERIFEFILQSPFDFAARYTSPFRDDNDPDCRFEQREDGTILFVDFGERLIRPNRTHRTCFRMVMDRYSVSLLGAVKIICKAFNLSTDSKDYKNMTVSTRYSHEAVSSVIINYEKRPPNKSDVIYWSQFLIRPEQLLEDHTFCTNRFSIKSNKKFSVVNVYKHCYVFDFITKCKIYQPYSDKYKWISTCDENCIGNIDNLPASGEELIIQKSYKDHRVVRNNLEGSNVIWFMNEGCVPALEILKNLIERFPKISIFYDNDKDGALASMKLLQVFSELKEGCARSISLPERCKYKDPAALISKEGRIDLIEVFKQIKLYGTDT